MYQYLTISEKYEAARALLKELDERVALLVKEVSELREKRNSMAAAILDSQGVQNDRNGN
jgi:FtsZ-binding cell division protein ZapB